MGHHTWMRSQEHKSIEEFLEASSGVPVAELLDPPATPPAAIQNMTEAAQVICAAVAAGRPVVVVGDYDADGITGTAILALLLWYLRVAKPRLVIPRRFTEGYGLPMKVANETRNSLVITVDNGIAAIDAVKELHAAEKNNIVVVLDHHLPGDSLPNADVIVDPHVQPEENGFCWYCGAGLAYKLAELILRKDNSSKALSLMKTLKVLACIGTIADVMPLIGDNRRIVKEGLAILDSDDRYRLPAGIRAILDLAGERIDEDTIAYQLAPLINAPGRMYDSGSRSTLKAILCTDMDTAYQYSGELKKINEERKAAVDQWYGAVYAKALKQQGKCPIVVFQRGIPEGIIGILAGKVAEALNTPSFVFSQGEDGSLVKGSGRSYGEFDLIRVLGPIRSLVEAAGGHRGAAGVTVIAKNYAQMRELMWACPECQEYEVDSSLKYDLEAYPEEIPEILEKMKPFVPFGEGVPRPVVRVRNASLYSEKGKGFMYMGQDQKHLKLFFKDFSAVGFGMGRAYQDAETPTRLELLGTVSENFFNGKVSVQMQLQDFVVAGD